MDKHRYNEAGRRLKAAMISHKLGLAGVDRTLKELPDDPGKGWAELAEQLDREMTMAMGNLLFPNLVIPGTKQ